MMGLPQGSPLTPILYNVYTKGLADLSQNGLSRVLTLADDGIIYIYTKQGIPRWQPKLCNNNWQMYLNGVKTLYF